MGLFDKFKKQQKAAPISGSIFSGMAQAPSQTAGRLIEASDESPWLSAVIHRIAGAVASSGWHAYREARGSETRLDAKHPVAQILDMPNPWLTGQQTLAMTQAHLDLAGESFWLIKRGEKTGRPVHVWPILPDWVSSVPAPMDPQGRYEINANANGLSFHGSYHTSDVVWFRRPTASNPYGRGPGIARSIADEIDTDENVARYVRAFFYNNATPAGLVSIEGASQEQATIFKRMLNQRHRGPDQAHQVMVTGRKVTWAALESAVKDLRTNDLRQFERDVIIQRFGVPPEILGIIENSNRATIESAAYLFAKYVVTPRAEALAQDLNSKFISAFDARIVQGVQIGFEDQIPEDRQFTLNTMESFPQAFTVAEVREIAGYDARPGDDVATAEPDAPVFGQPKSKAAKGPTDPGISEKVAQAIRPEALQEEMLPVYDENYQKWAQAALTDMGISVAFNMTDPRTLAHFNEFGATLIKVNETTQNMIRATMAEGIELGERGRGLAKRIRGVLGEGSDARALMISRTEVTRSANNARVTASKQSGVIAGHKWVSARAPLTRAEHEDLDGEVRKLGEVFASGSFVTEYPGESGVAAHDINCMCTVIPLTHERFEEEQQREERDISTHDAAAKAFEESTAPWESSSTKAIKRAFNKQLDAALDALLGD